MPDCRSKPIWYLAGLLVSAGCALLIKKPLKNVISELYCLPSFNYCILVILKRLYSGKIGRICCLYLSPVAGNPFFRDSYESMCKIRKDNLRYAKVLLLKPAITGIRRSETGIMTLYILVIGERRP